MPFVEFASSDLEQSIPARFERIAALHADRLAVRAGEESLTYAELNRRANRMADALLSRLGSGSAPVALLLRQGAPLVAAILAVLKTGKIYVPLDASHPPARLRTTVEEAGAEAVISSGAESGLALALGVADSHCLLCEELDAAGLPENPGLAIPPGTPAYIYFTSGSTGRPKGVYDSHRNVLHNVMRYTNTLRIAPEDRLTLLQGPAFSGAVSSLFGALLNGAAVFPYDVPARGIGASIGEWLRAEGITMYHSVPMLFRSFLGDGARFPAIRVVRLEGDAASRIDLELFQRHFAPEAILVNGLGTTETGIACQHFVGTGSELPEGVVPVGLAAPDMEAMVLDEAGDPIAGGAAGEIAIRSRYLALGYWRQPALTSSAFLPDPAGGDRRIYRTGDLGRRRPDGALEYLGRMDSMAKIRGQRVEPAEVESALLALPWVRQAAAIIRPDRQGTPVLMAYLVPRGSERPPVRELRRGLASELPDHMIPARFAWAEKLPYSDNGKVDRRALPAIDPGEALRDTVEAPPRDALERRLVELWEEVLDRSGVGIRDDFYELGGDSMKAAALLGALSEITPRDFPPSVLIDAPTIEQLGSLIRDEGPPEAPALVPIQPGGSKPPFFLVHAHTGQVGRCGDLPRALGPEQPFYGLQSIGWTGQRPPHASIEAMASHYVGEIRRVKPEGPYHLGGICFGGVVALEMAHQLTASGASVALLYLLWNTPTDFSELAEADAVRRFRGLQRRERLQRHWIAERLRGYAGQFRERRGLARLAYLGEVGSRIIRSRVRRPELTPLLRREEVISEVHRKALARYRHRPYPGRVTMLLLAEHQAMYSADPARDFGRVALQGYDISFLPWRENAIYREPEVQPLAAHLRLALETADR